MCAPSARLPSVKCVPTNSWRCRWPGGPLPCLGLQAKVTPSARASCRRPPLLATARRMLARTRVQSRWARCVPAWAAATAATAASPAPPPPARRGRHTAGAALCPLAGSHKLHLEGSQIRQCRRRRGRQHVSAAGSLRRTAAAANQPQRGLCRPSLSAPSLFPRLACCSSASIGTCGFSVFSNDTECEAASPVSLLRLRPQPAPRAAAAAALPPPPPAAPRMPTPLSVPLPLPAAVQFW